MVVSEGLPIRLGNGGSLRLLDEADVTQDYVDALNDPDINRFLSGARLQRQTFESVRDFVTANRRDPAALLFGLFVDGKLSGTCRLHDISPPHSWLGLVILDKSLWGKGWATKLITEATAYVLQHHETACVRAAIEPENHGSCRAFSKAGFTYRSGNDMTRDDGRIIQIWQTSH